MRKSSQISTWLASHLDQCSSSPSSPNALEWQKEGTCSQHERRAWRCSTEWSAQCLVVSARCSHFSHLVVLRAYLGSAIVLLCRHQGRENPGSEMSPWWQNSSKSWAVCKSMTTCSWGTHVQHVVKEFIKRLDQQGVAFWWVTEAEDLSLSWRLCNLNFDRGRGGREIEATLKKGIYANAATYLRFL